jgi:catechol O-methyltransferase
VGDKKGEILDAEIRKAQPQTVLEVGAYCGYSALRTARQLPAGAHLYSIEFDATNAAIATKIIEYAGLKDRVTVIIGVVGTRINVLKNEYNIKKLDLVFLDHEKSVYLSDFQLLEQANLIQTGTVVVADNCLFVSNSS